MDEQHQRGLREAESRYQPGQYTRQRQRGVEKSSVWAARACNSIAMALSQDLQSLFIIQDNQQFTYTVSIR